jgi:competence protein ComGF
MVCKTTSTKKSKSAFTLVEMIVTVATGMIVLTALALVFFFSNRSFASLTNYLDLDQKTQVALDKMSREIRQVNQLSSYTSNQLVFEDYDSGKLMYTFDPSLQTLVRKKQGVGSETLLTNCTSLQFSIFQRTPNTNTFQPVTTSTATNAKVIELTWNCSRTILGSSANNESMQSAMIVIRKK